jgi:Macrocin-O-methyltransferase (TylF)
MFKQAIGQFWERIINGAFCLFQKKGVETQLALEEMQENFEFVDADLKLNYAERMRLIDHYLCLMESCLTGVIYGDIPLSALGQKEYDPHLREYGWDWPSQAHTMIGRKRLRNVRDLVESVIGNDIAGDLIETGVWRGGACIMMRATLNAYQVADRKIWVADSFEGLPAPNLEAFPADEGSDFHKYEELSVSVDDVKDNFKAYGLLDESVCFLEGWFKDTLPNAPIDQLALIRLDGDLYESTIQPLDALYRKLSGGGYVIVDDYHVVKGCKEAIHDFFSKEGINPELKEIDGVGVYWQKEEKALPIN